MSALSSGVFAIVRFSIILFFSPYPDNSTQAYMVVDSLTYFTDIYAARCFIDWMIDDSVQTRSFLPKAFLYNLIAEVVRTLWLIFGAMLIFKGQTFSGYMFDKYEWDNLSPQEQREHT